MCLTPPLHSSLFYFVLNVFIQFKKNINCKFKYDLNYWLIASVKIVLISFFLGIVVALTQTSIILKSYNALIFSSISVKNKKKGLLHKRIIVEFRMKKVVHWAFATNSDFPIQTMNSVTSNSLRLNYQKLTTSGCKGIG